MPTFLKKLAARLRIASVKREREQLLGRVAAHKVYLLLDDIEDELIAADREGNQNKIDIAQAKLSVVNTIIGYVTP